MREKERLFGDFSHKFKMYPLFQMWVGPLSLKASYYKSLRAFLDIEVDVGFQEQMFTVYFI